MQLAGGYPDTLTHTTQLIVDECQVDFVDLNLGCPIDVINDKGAGCALGDRSRNLMQVLSCMGSVAKEAPITMRYGVKEGSRTSHFAMKKAADLGCAQLITLHPRYKSGTALHEGDRVGLMWTNAQR